MAREAGHWPFTWQYADTPAFWYQIRQTSVWGLGIPLGIVAWLAAPFTAWMAWRGGVAQRCDLLLLAWAVPAFVFLELFEVKFLRYVFPLMPFYILMGARMLGRRVWWRTAQLVTTMALVAPARRRAVFRGVARDPAHRRRRPHLRRTDLRRRRTIFRGMARHASHRRHGGVSDRAAGGTRRRCRPSAVLFGKPLRTVHRSVRLPGQHCGSGRRGSVHRPLRHRLLQHLQPSPHGGHGRRVDQRQRSVRRVHHQRRLLLGRAHSRPGPVRRLDVSRLPSGCDRSKIPELVDRLSSSDYVVFYSNRAYGSVARLTRISTPRARRSSACCSPETWVTGLERVVHLVSVVGRLRAARRPLRARRSLPPAGAHRGQLTGTGAWHWFGLNLGYADENVIGYDHPQVLVFRNVDRLSTSEIRSRIDDASARGEETPPLMLPPDALLAQQDGGTWSQVFRPDGWPSRVPVAQLVPGAGDHLPDRVPAHLVGAASTARPGVAVLPGRRAAPGGVGGVDAGQLRRRAVFD